MDLIAQIGIVVGIAVGLIAIFKFVVPLFRKHKEVGLPEEQEVAPQAPSRVLPDTTQRVSHIPVPSAKPSTKGMLGRDRDIADLKGLLENCKVLGIIGLATIGKSTVAAKLAEDLGGKYKACWEDMSGPYEFNAFVSELLWEIGGVSAERIKDYTPEQRIGALIGVLDEKRSLLVLDNFEHRLEERTISDLYLSQLLNACLRKGHRSKVIITSRENPEGLHVGYNKYDLGGIEKGSGVELLKRRGLKAEEKTLEFAEEKVDRHPYALQLLASLVISYGADLKRCLEEREIWPEEMEKEFLKEHYDRMSREERTILEGMSVYREPVPEEAVAVFDGDDVYELLRSLRNKSLVQSADELYFLHPTVRDYGYHELEKRKKQEVAHHKAAEWYESSYGQGLPRETNRPEPLKPYEEMIFHYFESGTKDDILKGARITNYVDRFLDRFGLYDKDLQMLERSKQILEGAALQKSKDYAAHLNNIGMIHDARGEYDEALRYYNDSLKIKKEIGDRAGEATTLGNIAAIDFGRGKYGEALTGYEDVLEIQKELGDRAGETVTLNNIGMIHDARGEYDEALRYYNDSLKIKREVGDRAGEAVTLNNMAGIHYDRGEYDEALRYFNDSLKIKKEIGDRAGEATSLHNIGTVYFEQEQYERAAEYMVPAYRMARDIGMAEAKVGKKWVDALSEKLGRDVLKEDSEE
ncbi:MAG: tetratricopeptide repeat protein [Candidatus Zixiibacteriota bacterium]